jgi:hypothetical protein
VENYKESLDSDHDNEEESFDFLRMNVTKIILMVEDETPREEKFLIPPATSVDSERCFSKSSETISKKRNRLNPKTCRHILCLNSWL